MRRVHRRLQTAERGRAIFLKEGENGLGKRDLYVDLPITGGACTRFFDAALHLASSTGPGVRVSLEPQCGGESLAVAVLPSQFGGAASCGGAGFGIVAHDQRGRDLHIDDSGCGQGALRHDSD